MKDNETEQGLVKRYMLIIKDSNNNSCYKWIRQVRKTICDEYERKEVMIIWVRRGYRRMEWH